MSNEITFLESMFLLNAKHFVHVNYLLIEKVQTVLIIKVDEMLSKPTHK